MVALKDELDVLVAVEMGNGVEDGMGHGMGDVMGDGRHLLFRPDHTRLPTFVVVVMSQRALGVGPGLSHEEAAGWYYYGGFRRWVRDAGVTPYHPGFPCRASVPLSVGREQGCRRPGSVRRFMDASRRGAHRANHAAFSSPRHQSLFWTRPPPKRLWIANETVQYSGRSIVVGWSRCFMQLV